MLRQLYSLSALLLVFGLHAGLAGAQSVQLTAEQQRLLNSLPASQRQAALEQLRNLQVTAAGGTDAEDPAVAPVRFEPPIEVEEDDEREIIAANDTVVLQVTPRAATDATASPADAEESAVVRDRLRNGNPYKLDSLGRIAIDGVGEIELAGLTAEQATLRLSSEPALSMFDVTVSKLPLQPVGVAALEPFGYQLFDDGPYRLQPNEALPVPAEYVVGTGDTLVIQLFGNQNADYELNVERDGLIRFPEIGPIAVAGNSYERVREIIGERVREQLIGTQVSVTLGEMRALQVFVVGDVKSPGSYAVSPMSTMTTALAMGEGVARQGSLRRIQLKRQGETVETLDLYDVLLRGDTRSDRRLQSGDVIFVPPVGNRVAVAGEVNRPAIYEFRGEASVEDAIALAGGFLPTAFRAGVKIERLDPAAGLLVIEADQAQAGGRGVRIADGDTVVVPKGVAQLEQAVRLMGNVQRPGDYQWRPGLRISDLLRSSRDLRINSDLDYVLIRRELVPNAELEVLSADLRAAWSMPGSDANQRLQPRDTVYVFDLRVGRNHIVEPLIEELDLRASRTAPLPVVRIGGRVNAEGQYPLESEMRLSDLVRAGGGLADSAYLDEAELSRYEIVSGERREIDLITVDLDAALAGDASKDLLLQPFDYLNIKEVPRWRDQEFVEIRGEVAFPGRYPIQQGEKLTDLLERAGGLTNMAFPAGSVFTRESLREREREQLDVLADRLETDLASMSLADPGQSEAASIGQSLLEQIRTTDPVGRLVINLESVLAGNSEDVILKDGDTLMIPEQAQAVTVIGEVQYATSHLHDPGLGRAEYIDMSGGMTRRADKQRIYVVRANGEVVIRDPVRFFARANSSDIRPGDTIVVPLNADRVKPITLWTSATQILYNLAIAAAAVNSF